MTDSRESRNTTGLDAVMHAARRYLRIAGISPSEVGLVTVITFLAVGLDGFAIALLLPLLRIIEQGTDQGHRLLLIFCHNLYQS